MNYANDYTRTLLILWIKDKVLYMFKFLGDHPSHGVVVNP